ncbi:type VII secretion integral membrane protein EccD [Corynebacterium hylobatis]|uniref:type VII secretion integral membrane protein EccD n=1 Tax=Corynebacterium hylobatis TaxID=1859290 RepID=UPI0013DFAA8B|nr:type VII secretion integral membrane protein EccD [Corynebacterium hylobatis]
MSVDHVLRLTVRFQVGTYHREADLALPAGSTLAEVIPEIVTLVGAPRISRPWQATTAAGTTLDPAVPLHQTPLDHGAVVVLTPRHEAVAPVVRDAAEALSESAGEARTGGLAAAGAVAGVAAVLAVGVGLLPTAQALALATIAAVTVLVVRRTVRVLAPVAVLLAGSAAGAGVLEAARPEEAAEPATLGLAALTAVAAAAVMLLFTVVVAGIGARTAAASATVLGMASVAAAGAFLPGHAAQPGVASAALVLAAGVVLMGQLPGLATRTAGLRVPRLPTAGQDLGVADEVQPDVDARARRARHLHEGAALGAAGAMIPTLAVIGLHGGGFAQALCVAVAGTVLLHAARHRQAVAAWSWMLVGLVACVAGAVAAAEPGNPLQWAVALVLAGVGLGAPVWAPRVPDLEPTALVWWERAESLALAASLPLAAHLAGLFVLIRGLG